MNETSRSAAAVPAQDLPWWRVPAAWLTFGGPCVVVVAGFVTLAMAIHGADLPLREGAAAPRSGTLAPATQARNHAAVAPR